MVSGQKEAMIDSTAPNPSVEAILHALIPFKVVDHTHADAIVTISNSKNGKKYIDELFPNFLIIPYVMPGFILAQKIYEATTDNFDWNRCEGIILHNHGIFTFDDDAKKSYSKMIKAVSLAEEFLELNANVDLAPIEPSSYNIDKLKELIEVKKGFSVVMKINQTPLALKYASKNNLVTFATRGVLTPEHILRTKRVPLILEDENMETSLNLFEENYKSYFKEYENGEIVLNSTPNYAVIKNYGVVSFGKDEKEANIINDIVEHTMLAVLRADILGGYESISEANSFAMEYWELEQAKLKK